MILKKYEENFLSIVDKINEENEKEKIISAYEFAKKHHKWQIRKSGTPYIVHPLAVSISLRNRFKSVDLMISWLLHDTVEDCDWVNIEDIYRLYWKNVWYIVDSITKTDKTFFNENEVFEDERDKMLHGGMNNIWCLLVKLADREHNLATLNFMPKSKQVKKSFESQALYMPLMNILKFNEEWITIAKCRDEFNLYLDSNKIDCKKSLKKCLFNICFYEFTEEIFDVVYNNSTSVLWELKDKKIFEELVEWNIFNDETIELLSITWDAYNYFKAIFKVRPWITFDKIEKIKLKKNIFIT